MTEGIRYTGSKRAIIPRILELVKSLKIQTVLDGFSGTTRVGQAFKQAGYSVDSNDLAVYSKIFGLCYLIHNDPARTQDLQQQIAQLNTLVGKEGYFTKYYGGKDYNGKSIQPDGKKRIWQTHNTMK